MPTHPPSSIEARSGLGTKRLAIFGIVLWCAIFAVVVVLVIIDPAHRSVVMNYSAAAENFSNGAPLYNLNASTGFIYLPGFAVAYIPMQRLGLPLGELVWRIISIFLLAFSVWRMSNRLAVARTGIEITGIALLIAFVGAASAIQNGQSTTLLLAATILAFDALYDRSLAKAAAWAVVATLAKPLGIVVWLLVAGLRPAALLWLIVFLAALIALPFAFGTFDYATATYIHFVDTLHNISPAIGHQPWTDLMAIPRVLGIDLSQEIAYTLRAFAAVATLLIIRRLSRQREYLESTLVPVVLAAAYMLLFNPRAEINTYILMSVPVGVMAAFLYQETDMWFSGSVLTVLCIFLGTGVLGRPLMELLDPWSKPVLMVAALTVIFLALPKLRKRILIR